MIQIVYECSPPPLLEWASPFPLILAGQSGYSYEIQTLCFYEFKEGQAPIVCGLIQIEASYKSEAIEAVHRGSQGSTKRQPIKPDCPTTPLIFAGIVTPNSNNYFLDNLGSHMAITNHRLYDSAQVSTICYSPRQRMLSRDPDSPKFGLLFRSLSELSKLQ